MTGRTQSNSTKFLLFAVLFGISSGVAIHQIKGQTEKKWSVHDLNRPVPPLVEPGSASTEEKAGRPPSDAIVLFDGRDPSPWQMSDGSPPQWKVRDGYLEVVGKSGSLVTRQGFGDCQLHREWSAPLPAVSSGQYRGNCGVYFMGLYEVQVLDSYQNVSYADGQAAAIYGQYPPLVNAVRPPGQWQIYDIIFRSPKFDDQGKCTSPAFFTVLHNGVLVQDHVELTGPTENKARPPYKAHPEKLPLMLQDHSCPVRYRNIWIRELS